MSAPKRLECELLLVATENAPHLLQYIPSALYAAQHTGAENFMVKTGVKFGARAGVAK